MSTRITHQTAVLSLMVWLLACESSPTSRQSSTSPASTALIATDAGARIDSTAAPESSHEGAQPDVHFDPHSSCAWGDPAKLGWTPAVCRALTRAEGAGSSESNPRSSPPTLASPDSSPPQACASASRHPAEPDASTLPHDPSPASPHLAMAPSHGPCPPDMVYVHGTYCGLRRLTCARWIEDPAKNPFARCGAYKKPTKCSKLEPSVYKEFCIDRYEAAGPDGLPLADKSWNQAKHLCEQAGKRLCKESEWTFACEGEEGRPYPYGYVRNNKICNFEITDGLIDKKGRLADHRLPVTSNPKCVSPFGVQNMVGNIDEWVELDRPYYSHRQKGRRMMSGLKGGWWGPLRNRCRPVTVDHDEVFHELQTGFRCCKDVDRSARDAGAVDESGSQ